MVLPPILDNLEISFRSDTPFIRAASINGIAINFNEFMKMVPKGFIQSFINSLPKSKFTMIRAKITPNNIPNNICQCSANFFIYIYYKIISL